MDLTANEHDDLIGQLLGRLATLGPDGSPQTRPVGYFVNDELGTIDIGGHNIVQSQKFRNVQRDPRVSLVVDDLATIDPWAPLGVEIRGTAEVLPDALPPRPGSRRGSSGSIRPGCWDGASTPTPSLRRTPAMSDPKARSEDHRRPCAPASRRRVMVGNDIRRRGFWWPALRPAPLDGPVSSIDHFLMDEPTFRPHPHAGFSAVTVMFEDSPGTFRNRDSARARPHAPRSGTSTGPVPGRASSTRVPTVPGIGVHGAQIFIALPPALELTAPQILHTDAADIAAVTASSGARIRVSAGELDGVPGPRSGPRRDAARPHHPCGGGGQARSGPDTT